MSLRILVLNGLFITSIWASHAISADDQITKSQPSFFSVLLNAKVHEAFVAPENYYSEIPAPAPKVAPADLVEVKPAIAVELQKKAVWVPGYWEWDAEGENFIWTTGVWRFPPPGHRWLAGKWTRTDEGYIREPGKWIPAAMKTITYVSAPPRYRGSFPLASSVGEENFWVPGYWIPADEGKFTWREGAAARRVDNWVWVPAQYFWTAKGWSLVDGYWDYPLNARGQVFASLKLNDETYDSDQVRVDTFAPIPHTAISESSSGEFVYSVSEIEGKMTFVSVDSVGIDPPEAPTMIVQTVADSLTGKIRGTVRRGALAPDGIEVELVGHTSPVVTTDEQGRFAFANVPYGIYYIRARGPVQNHVRRAYGKIQVSEPMVEAQLELR